MSRKNVLNKRNKIGDELTRLKKSRGYNKDERELNIKINLLKKQYTFYNKLLKIV